MQLEAWLHNNKVKGKLYDLSAVTTCRICGGIVVIALTDDNRRVLPYKDMVGWFYELHVTAMECVGKRNHTEEQGWGYYWGLDHVLRTMYPRKYEEDLEARGRKQHFGVDIGGCYPKVQIVQTTSPLSTNTIKPVPGSGMPIKIVKEFR